MIYNPKLLAAEIDARLAESPRMTLSRLARDLGVSRRTITRLLESEKHMPYRSYQQSLLLKLALQLLAKAGNLTIKEIAFSLGYSSPEAFARFIRSKTGKCPSTIRIFGSRDVP